MFKLVKDKMPDILKEEGKECEFATVNTKNLHLSYLKQKLVEITNSYLTTGLIDYLAELQIVINSLVKIEGLTKENFDSTVEAKVEVEGAYDNGYIAFFQEQQPVNKEEK